MKILKNEKNQIRCGWRILFFTLFHNLINLGFGMILGIIVAIYMLANDLGSFDSADFSRSISNFIVSSDIGVLLSSIASLAALIITLLIVLKAFDKKRFSDIGFNSITKNMKGLIWGLLLGAASMSLIFVVLISTGNLTVSNFHPNFTTNTLIGIPLYIAVGMQEEIMCRGYILNTLNDMGKPWLSVLLSSAVFAALHLLNPNVSAFGIINIFLVGVLFSYMFLKTKSLWMPIGYHITWNYFQGNVFGFPVSGTTHSKGLYIINSYKDNILTGGQFGPEAGILTTIVLALGFLLIGKLYNKKGQGNSQFTMHK